MSHTVSSSHKKATSHSGGSKPKVTLGGARKKSSSTRSRTGKRRVLPKVKRNLSLRSYGYSSSKPSKQRKAILLRIVRHEDPLAVARRLRLIANYVRVTDPARYMIYKHDAGMLFRLYQSMRESHGLLGHHPVHRVRRVVKRRRTTLRKRAAPRRRVAKRRSVSSHRRH